MRRLLLFLKELRIPALIGLAALGAFLALSPAWLPETPRLPSARLAVEILQALFLIASSILFFAAAAHTGRYSSGYRAMGWFALAAVIAEVAHGHQDIGPYQIKVRWLALLPLTWGLLIILRHLASASALLKIFSRRASAGILATALLLNYIFTPILSSKLFWKAALDSAYLVEIPQLVRNYLQLFCCYLILVGATSLSLNHPLVPVEENDPDPL